MRWARRRGMAERRAGDQAPMQDADTTALTAALILSTVSPCPLRTPILSSVCPSGHGETGHPTGRRQGIRSVCSPA